MIHKEMSLVSNYKISVWTTENLAKFLAKKMHHSWSIWLFIDKYWQIKKKYQEVLMKFLREQQHAGVFLSLMWIRYFEWHNIVPLVLREEFASLIAWNTVVPSFAANYMALWSGNTAPDNSDTWLETETIRWIFTNRFSVDNTAYLDKFFSSVEVWWNSYLEAWIFVDWTALTDSWYLLSRILIDQSMSATENLTINASITIA